MDTERSAWNFRSLAFVLLSIFQGSCGAGASHEDQRSVLDQPGIAKAVALSGNATTSGAALDTLRAAVEASPSEPQARRKLAVALRDARRMEESLAQFEKLVELEASVPNLLDLAATYTLAAQLPQAEAAFQRALALEPKSAAALDGLGTVRLAQGNVTAARELYQRAVAADPAHLLAHYHLASMWVQANQFQDAYRAFEKVLELDPQTPDEARAAFDSLYSLATLDLRMGAVERGLRFLEELLQAFPDHPEANRTYGEALSRLGREADAQRAFEAHERLQQH